MKVDLNENPPLTIIINCGLVLLIMLNITLNRGLVLEIMQKIKLKVCNLRATKSRHNIICRGLINL